MIFFNLFGDCDFFFNSKLTIQFEKKKEKEKNRNVPNKKEQGLIHIHKRHPHSTKKARIVVANHPPDEVSDIHLQQRGLQCSLLARESPRIKRLNLARCRAAQSRPGRPGRSAELEDAVQSSRMQKSDLVSAVFLLLLSSVSSSDQQSSSATVLALEDLAQALREFGVVC